MRIRQFWCFVLLMTTLPGCIVMSPLPRDSMVELPDSNIQTFSTSLDADGNRLPVDFTKFQPGSFCKLESISKDPADNRPGKNGGAASAPSTRVIAGRIVDIDESYIVLTDAISISSRPASTVAVPATTKAMAYTLYGPMAPRLFKSTAMGRETIAIPGDVTIERELVRDLQPVDGTNWAATQNSGKWLERIGIDFDFNVTTNEREKSVSMTPEFHVSQAK